MAVISASRNGKPSGHRGVTDFEFDGDVSTSPTIRPIRIYTFSRGSGREFTSQKKKGAKGAAKEGVRLWTR